ncbi:type II toxin-antitoxin system Phd/YefM family antitoxin [Streptomyces luteogriseus]|uniref:type II toxin-antitoxin system Phd/YefM family antitoxin n=1 Tax=Streptomyces luteogriseus TaxID=68233 RepID=UPI0038247C4B
MTATPTEHRAKIAEARNVLGEVISRARYAGEPTVLINRGKEAAVIVSYEDYATLRELRGYVEDLEALDSPDARQKARILRESLDLAKGRALDL